MNRPDCTEPKAWVISPWVKHLTALVGDEDLAKSDFPLALGMVDYWTTKLNGVLDKLAELSEKDSPDREKLGSTLIELKLGYYEELRFNLDLLEQTLEGAIEKLYEESE